MENMSELETTSEAVVRQVEEENNSRRVRNKLGE